MAPTLSDLGWKQEDTQDLCAVPMGISDQKVSDSSALSAHIPEVEYICPQTPKEH